MNERIYAIFDGAATGAQLAITQGGTVVQTFIVSDNKRFARGSVPISLHDVSNAELVVYSPDAINPAPVLTSKATMIGICTAAANINNYLGADANGYGYSPGDGTVTSNGATVATIGTATFGDVISVVVDPWAATLTFQKNGQALGSAVTITASKAWYFAAGVSGNPGDLAVVLNSNATPMQYPIPGLTGWWSPRVTIEPLFLATEPYITLPTDSLAHQKFNGDVERHQSPVSLARGVNFWMWGASKPPALTSGSLAQMDILDPNKIYDVLLTNDVRDLPVTFSRVAQGTSFNAAEASYSAVIDHVEQTSDQTKRLYLKDKLVLLQTQLVRPLFLPTADPSVAGKPRPISIGVCRTYVPELYNATTFLYACGDDPIAAFGQVRLNGVDQIYGGPYAITADAEGVQWNAAPVGKVTVESTDVGGSFSSTATDALAGTGVFGSATAQPSGTYATQPVGWQGDGGYYGQDLKTQVMTLVGTAPNKTVQQQNKAFAVYTLKDTSALVIQKGRSYSYSIAFAAVPSYGGGFDPVTNQPIYANPATISFGWIGNSNSNASIAFFNWALFPVPTATTYSGVFTNTTNADQPFVIGFMCNARIAPGGGYYELASVKLEELPPVGQLSSLAGRSLDSMLQALLIARGPFSTADYDSTGAIAIDAAQATAMGTAAGYVYGLHIKSSETPTVQAAAKQVLDSATADLFVNRAGEVECVRLFAPESYTGTLAGSLTVTDFSTFLQQWPDNAENLTTRLSGARNYDPLTQADFANVTISQVPLAEQKILQQPYQWTAVGGNELSPRYAHAASASALGTCLDVQAHGQAEADRITALYSVPRNFYVGDVFTPIGRTFEIGDVWNITYPTGSLTAGQKLLVVGITEKPSECISTVTFWGL